MRVCNYVFHERTESGRVESRKHISFFCLSDVTLELRTPRNIVSLPVMLIPDLCEQWGWSPAGPCFKKVLGVILGSQNQVKDVKRRER